MSQSSSRTSRSNDGNASQSFEWEPSNSSRRSIVSCWGFDLRSWSRLHKIHERILSIPREGPLTTSGEFKFDPTVYNSKHFVMIWFARYCRQIVSCTWIIIQIPILSTVYNFPRQDPLCTLMKKTCMHSGWIINETVLQRGFCVNEAVLMAPEITAHTNLIHICSWAPRFLNSVPCILLIFLGVFVKATLCHQKTLPTLLTIEPP